MLSQRFAARVDQRLKPRPSQGHAQTHTHPTEKIADKLINLSRPCTPTVMCCSSNAAAGQPACQQLNKSYGSPVAPTCTHTMQKNHKPKAVMDTGGPMAQTQQHSQIHCITQPHPPLLTHCLSHKRCAERFARRCDTTRDTQTRTAAAAKVLQEHRTPHGR